LKKPLLHGRRINAGEIISFPFVRAGLTPLFRLANMNLLLLETHSTEHRYRIA
jgi:hypothetical protein